MSNGGFGVRIVGTDNIKLQFDTPYEPYKYVKEHPGCNYEAVMRIAHNVYENDISTGKTFIKGTVFEWKPY